jgi:hypothetical protein
MICFIMRNTQQSAKALHSFGSDGDGEVMSQSLHDASTVDAECRKRLNEVAKACMDAEQGRIVRCSTVCPSPLSSRC